MPTELEELVHFINHGNTQVRQVAVENLVPYSLSQPSIFKVKQLLPVRHLKLLVRDYEQTARDALTILINLSTDREVLENLITDDDFLHTMLSRIMDPMEPHADLHTMILANLSKSPSILNLLTLTRPAVPYFPSTTLTISQLLDLFVQGAFGRYNSSCNFDYLAYLFADLASRPQGRSYFLTRQGYDNLIPLTKLVVFTEHSSEIRKKGVASTIKNCCFEIPSHASILCTGEINILPYILLPLMGGEAHAEEEMDGMLEDLQLLPPDKEREKDPEVLKAHLETLILLTTTREGRDRLREAGCYYVVRETHLAVEDGGVREGCERLVQVLMRDEEGNEAERNGMRALGSNKRRAGKPKEAVGGVGSWAQAAEDSDDDDRVVEV